MINMFKVRRWAAFIFAGYFTVLGFFIGYQFYNMVIAIACMFVCSIMGILVGSLMIRNPFSAMMEGKGILCLNIDSTGIIRPFVVSLVSPWIKGKLGKKEVKDIWDRDAVMDMDTPVVAGKGEPTKEGGFKITITRDEFNKNRFRMLHYPTLIYNDQMGNFLTKEFLSDKEKQAYAEHGILYTNRKMEELSGYMRDFARHVVNQLKPALNIFTSSWFWIIAIIFLVIMLVLFGKPLLSSVMGGGALSALPGMAVSPQ